eukprot:Skav209105  [mRNA]  locus=scaffold179:149112:149456:+ [translate_table: standard]
MTGQWISARSRWRSPGAQMLHEKVSLANSANRVGRCGIASLAVGTSTFAVVQRPMTLFSCLTSVTMGSTCGLMVPGAAALFSLELRHLSRHVNPAKMVENSTAEVFQLAGQLLF